LAAEHLPFFADGSIVGDYKPLIKYWELLKKVGRDMESVVLKREDFKYLEEVVESNPGLDVASLINMLQYRFLERIDCKLAAEAYREVYGFDIGEEDACKNLARIVAGWLIEAGESMGVLKLRIPWRSDRDGDSKPGGTRGNTS